MKFLPRYQLKIGVPPFGPTQAAGQPDAGYQYAQSHLTIELPYRCDFSIRREFLASAQTGNFKLYNLGSTTRDAIYKDRYATFQYAQIQFYGGYEDGPMTLMFSGNVREASSRRLGRNNYVTEIDAFDGGFAYANSFSAVTFPPRSSLSEILLKLNSDLLQVNPIPIIGTVPDTMYQRAAVFIGKTMDLIQGMTPVGVSSTIDNNQLKVLSDSDVLSATDNVFVIESATGLMGPPVRSGTFITCEILFEPRLTLGQKVQLISIDNAIFNGFYQVRGISHEGVISGATAGRRVTTVQLYLGPNNLRTLSGAFSVGSAITSSL